MQSVPVCTRATVGGRLYFRLTITKAGVLHVCTMMPPCVFLEKKKTTLEVITQHNFFLLSFYLFGLSILRHFKNFICSADLIIESMASYYDLIYHVDPRVEKGASCVRMPDVDVDVAAFSVRWLDCY